MDIISKTFDILKQHFQLKDNWGNNPYMPKEKFDAVLKDVQAHVSEVFRLGEKHGELLALGKLKAAHEQFFKTAIQDAEVKDEHVQNMSRYLKWREEFYKSKENVERPEQSG